MKFYLSIIGIVLCGLIQLQAQFIHFGVNYGVDLYQNVRTPDNEVFLEQRSLGAAVLNFVGGPKLWFGNGNMSIGLEASVNLSPVAFDTKKNHGLGMLSFPVLLTANFKGLSTISDDVGTGFSFGGGAIFTNTELYFLSDEYANQEGSLRTTRLGYFPNYVGQVAYGFGSKGTNLQLNVKYGIGPNDSQFFSVGIMVENNYTALKNLKKAK